MDNIPANPPDPVREMPTYRLSGSVTATKDTEALLQKLALVLPGNVQYVEPAVGRKFRWRVGPMGGEAIEVKPPYAVPGDSNAYWASSAQPVIEMRHAKHAEWFAEQAARGNCAEVHGEPSARKPANDPAPKKASKPAEPSGLEKLLGGRKARATGGEF